ncbi:MAG: hypothetical protein KF773_07050 [Deltaproteobacteria bacterium]|nr:hypothetical protein [Deltaproteobacteria bacterium]
MRSLFLVLGTIVLLVDAARAAEWTLKVSQDATGGIKAEPQDFTSSMDFDGTVRTLRVTCINPVLCTDMRIEGAPIDASRTTATELVATVDKASTIFISHLAQRVFTLKLTAPATEETTLRTMLSRSCKPSGSVGSREVVVTPLGTMLTQPPKYFAETETLTVTVVGDARLVPLLSVVRKSGTRVVGLNLLGEGTDIKLRPQAQKDGAPVVGCMSRSFTLADFAAGTGEVEIAAWLGDAPQILGGFQFVVDPVYHGMFSFGAVWTKLLAPEFVVAQRAGTNVVVQTEGGDRRLSYAFLYTPFLWHGLERDIRKPIGNRVWEYFNPSLGFVADDPLNNALVGITFDLQSALLVTGGFIFSHVNRLDEIGIGDAFAGTSAEIPTKKVWKRAAFIGVTVDVRVAVKLLRMVLGTASTGS